MQPASRYVIRIKGILDENWSDWFDGMAIQTEPSGETSISGEVRDQAAMVGLINRIHDLGLVLISVVPLA